MSTTSASPSRTICSAWSGVVISPTAPVAIFAFVANAPGEGDLVAGGDGDLRSGGEAA